MHGRGEDPMDDAWILCLGMTRPVIDGRVRCAVQARRMPIAACLLCRHLETLADERDDVSCVAAGAIRGSPDPR